MLLIGRIVIQSSLERNQLQAQFFISFCAFFFFYCCLTVLQKSKIILFNIFVTPKKSKWMPKIKPFTELLYHPGEGVYPCLPIYTNSAGAVRLSNQFDPKLRLHYYLSGPLFFSHIWKVKIVGKSFHICGYTQLSPLQYNIT